MKKIISYPYEIDINLYVVHSILECIIAKLYLPNPYYQKVSNLTRDIGNHLFSFPKNIDDLDFIGEKVEITSYYQDNKKNYSIMQ